MKGFVKITFDNTPNRTVSIEFSAEQAGKNSWFNAVPLIKEQQNLDLKHEQQVDFMFCTPNDHNETAYLGPQEVHAKIIENA